MKRTPRIHEGRVRFDWKKSKWFAHALDCTLALSLLAVTGSVRAQRHYHPVDLGKSFNYDSYLNRTFPIAMSGNGYLGGSVPGQNNDPYGDRRAILLKNQTVTLLPYFGVNSFNYSDSGVLGINRLGQAVGYSHAYDSRSNDRGFGAFFWNNGVFARLPDLGMDGFGATNTRANAINDSGDIVGYSDTYDSEFLDTGPLAFLYHNGTSTPIGNFGSDHNGYHYSYATGINSSGQIGGYAEVYDTGHHDTGQFAFLYSNGTTTILPTPVTITPGVNGVYATGINDSGQMVGYAARFLLSPYTNPQSTPCVWNNGTVTVLPDLSVNYQGDHVAYAYSLNNSGDIVGSSNYYDPMTYRSSQHGVLWHNGAVYDVNTLLLTTSTPLIYEVSGISDGGRLGAQAYLSFDLHTLLLVPVAGGDFKGNGLSDVVFQNQNTGTVGVWFLNNLQYSNGDIIHAPIPVNYQLLATPDLNGDGFSDLVFLNTNNGDILYWLLNGTTVTSRVTLASGIPPAWRIVGSADIVGDGYTDLIFQNQTTGDLAYWQMQGTTFVASRPLTNAHPGSAWQVTGLADLDHDGSTDLVFRNTQTGDVAYWLLQGETLKQGGILATGIALDWTLSGAGDVNGDGSVALLWQNATTGAVAAWTLSGTTLAGSHMIASNLPAGWKLVGPR